MNTKTLKELLESTTDELVNIVYNRYASDLSNHALFPCIGMIWYDVDFASKNITICKTDNYINNFIGVTDNTKWYLPWRKLARKEVDIFINFIDRVVKEKGTSRDYGTTMINTDKILRELNDWMQSLVI